MENLKYYEMELDRYESFGVREPEYVVISVPGDMDEDDLVDYAVEVSVTNPYDYVVGIKTISEKAYTRRLPDNRHM